MQHKAGLFFGPDGCIAADAPEARGGVGLVILIAFDAVAVELAPGSGYVLAP